MQIQPMKKYWLLLLMLPAIAFSQKGVFSKTDPLTGEKIIATHLSWLFASGTTPILQVMVTGTRDSTKKVKYAVDFIQPDLNYDRNSGMADIEKKCLLKLHNGEVLRGIWDRNSTAYINGRQLSSSFYSVRLI